MPSGPARLERAVLGLLGWLGFLALVLAWGLLVTPLTGLAGALWPGLREGYPRWTSATLGAFLRRLPYMRLDVQRDARCSGSCILVANHQSRLDSLLMIALEPGLCGPVRGYVLRIPLIGAILGRLGFFDVDTGATRRVRAVQRAAARARQRGEPLLFYPEGTRSRDGRLGPFQRGAFRAAVDHGLPVQPVVIEGIEQVLPPGAWLPLSTRRHPVRIRYLEPVPPPFGVGPRREVVRDLAERVRLRMAEELARLRAQRAEQAA